jgi:stage II sporulation protein P
MDIQSKVLRMGAAAILCALVFRLTALGYPQMLLSWVLQPDITAFLIYLETGRDVRFSPSSQVFSPEFAGESAPPLIREPEWEYPVFSGTEAAAGDIYYACSLRPDLGALLEKPLSWDLTAPEPTVLILHTHTTESYTKSGETYQETSAYRTLDEQYNMLSIGDAVGRILAENGITAVHDRQLHDYPSYNGSYNDARKAIQAYLQEYPGIRLVLDLHRDAADTATGQLRTLANVEGSQTAQLMLVMGTDAAGLSHPDWQENLALGLKLHTLLQRQYPGLMRPLLLRSQRFNQDMSPGALLVEVGAAGNTHAEALAAAQLLAEGIVQLARGTQ